jgi:hypothetical protein
MRVAKDSRLYAELSIEMDEHPKIIGLSDPAFRALFEALFYSRRMTSDGVLDERVVLRRWGKDVADELSCNDPEKPSWVRIDRGWLIHDFLEHNPSRAEIEDKRADLKVKRSVAGSKGAASRWHPDGKTMANDGEKKIREEKRNSSSTKKREPATRGSRLSPDWLPSAASVAKAKTDAPDVDVRSEHPVFVDYWIAQPGQRGVKVDWEATWRNWMRRKQGDRKVSTPTRQTAAQKNLSTVGYFEAQERKGLES